MRKQTIGFIGVGNMASAIIEGIIASKFADRDKIAVFDISKEKMDKCSNDGFIICQDACELCRVCDIIFLAIKPQNFEEVIPSISSYITDDKLIVSIAAGISTDYIQNLIGHSCRVIRIMPNIPLTIGHGASAISCKAPATEEDFNVIFKIFSSMGCARRIDEGKMNEIIGVNGSTPAFVFYIIREILSYAESNGIPYDTAKELVCHTFIGSSKMLMKSDKTPSELVKMVTSPGGTTQKSVDVFDESNLPNIMKEAIEKCVDRAYELGK